MILQNRRLPVVTFIVKIASFGPLKRVLVTGSKLVSNKGASLNFELNFFLNLATRFVKTVTVQKISILYLLL
jgi:hypothetical protein